MQQLERMVGDDHTSTGGQLSLQKISTCTSHSGHKCFINKYPLQRDSPSSLYKEIELSKNEYCWSPSGTLTLSQSPSLLDPLHPPWSIPLTVQSSNSLSISCPSASAASNLAYSKNPTLHLTSTILLTTINHRWIGPTRTLRIKELSRSQIGYYTTSKTSAHHIFTAPLTLDLSVTPYNLRHPLDESRNANMILVSRERQASWASALPATNPCKIAMAISAT